MTANDRLKALVDGQGRKYTWLANQLGTPLYTVSSILNGKTKMTADFLEKACRVLGCQANQIIPINADSVEPNS